MAFGILILQKTQYKTYNNEFLAIIKNFEIWWHYSKSCKCRNFVIVNYKTYVKL